MEEEILENAYQTIARHITASTGQCVLILGPELSINKSGIGYKTFFRETIPVSSNSRYFDIENLFHFEDNLDSNYIKDKVIKYYKEVGDPALMEMISRIPIPLIINVCPDKALNNVLKSKGIPYCEGYFTKDSKAKFNPIIPEPTKENPVIYNILGSIDLEQSLILTHKKLYETMEFLLPEKSLPDNIEHYLKSTVNSFIFLGFKFDSWQYQLICHKLGVYNKDETNTNISSPNIIENENVSIIMRKSFDMKFTAENPMQCIHNVIAYCEKESSGSMREKNTNGSYSTFISYARNDQTNENRENIVNLIEQKFTTLNQGGLFQLFRDRNDLKFGDSIDSFMTHIGIGKIVIRVISHKYLTSIYCMVEACRMTKYNDKDKRILTIVMNDANIDADDSIKKYKEYWFNECQTILEDPTKLNNGNYDDYVMVYRNIDQIIYNIKDQVYLALDYTDVIQNPGASEIAIAESKKADFDAFMNEVFTKIQED